MTTNSHVEHSPSYLKEVLRRQILARRRQFAAGMQETHAAHPGGAALNSEVAGVAGLSDWEAASRSAQERILGLAQWQTARQVLLYSPVRGEIDTRLLFEAALAAGKQTLFPRCISPRAAGYAGCMELAPCTGPEQLIPGSFKIPEPSPHHCPPLAAEQLKLDLALIPGVAFSRKGERLGYGGGYYDRFFAANLQPCCLFIGFCAGFQLLDSLPSEPWDLKVDAVCTEEEIIFFAK